MPADILVPIRIMVLGITIELNSNVQQSPTKQLEPTTVPAQTNTLFHNVAPPCTTAID